MPRRGYGEFVRAPFPLITFVNFPDKYYKQFPKIIYNKVKLDRQFIITYKYKGKEYTLKTPKMIEEWEVEYRPIGNLLLD